MNSEQRFKDKHVGVSKNPVLIVGQNPGRQRSTEETLTAWEGNRSADLLNWALGDQQNLLLTNVCQYQELTPERIEEGLYDLYTLVQQVKPRKIICLGDFAYRHVESLRINNSWMYQRYLASARMLHPSFVARFNKDREAWRDELLKEINDGN